MSRIGLTNSF